MPEKPGFKIIAVDGGAATGKSSTSRAVARQLGLLHVDTGAHYRTITYALLQAGAQADQSLEQIPSHLEQLGLGTTIIDGSAHLSINGAVPASSDIRSPAVNTNVSKFAAIPAVRTFLFNYQRSQAEIARAEHFNGLIMEGRDIGSVIFPYADYRFFLFADEATRAARRAKEGQTDSIATRDKMDASRKTAPMVCPEGAIRIDTGSFTLDEVIAELCQVIEA